MANLVTLGLLAMICIMCGIIPMGVGIGLGYAEQAQFLFWGGAAGCVVNLLFSVVLGALNDG